MYFVRLGLGMADAKYEQVVVYAQTIMMNRPGAGALRL